MVNTEEGWHTMRDGVKVYTKTWKPDGPPKALVVFLHGFSDHCNAYGELFPTFANRGVEVRAYDGRGWGRSVLKAADKGLTGPTSTVMDDITSFLETTLPPLAPLFLMGHSMGGAQVFTYSALGPEKIRQHIRGYVGESPFLSIHLASRPTRATVVVCRLVGKLLPKRQMVQKLHVNLLSRDADANKALTNDPLCHDTGTLEGLAGMLDRAADLLAGRVSVTEGAGRGPNTSLWVGHGTSDMICDFEGTKSWFDGIRVKDKEFKVYDGWYHRLHSEPGDDKVTFANDAATWILDRSKPSAVEAEEGKSRL